MLKNELEGYGKMKLILNADIRSRPRLRNKVDRIAFTRRRTLKRNSTPAEKKLWEFLQTRPLGFKFRQQAIMRGFIVDFKCFALKLVIEVDGSELTKKELRREKIIVETMSHSILRFSNSEVMRNYYACTKMIQFTLDFLSRQKKFYK